MEKLTIAQLNDVYSLFEKSFVDAELRDYSLFKELFEEGMFDLYGQYEDNKLLGAMSIWEIDDFCYIENFAIHPSLRGQGKGTEFLNELVHMTTKDVLLEVEKVFDTTSLKRIEFYKKNGFHFHDFCYIQPPLREGASQEVELHFMNYPKSLSHDELENRKRKIFKNVYRQNKENV